MKQIHLVGAPCSGKGLGGKAILDTFPIIKYIGTGAAVSEYLKSNPSDTRLVERVRNRDLIEWDRLWKILRKYYSTAIGGNWFRSSPSLWDCVVRSSDQVHIAQRYHLISRRSLVIHIDASDDTTWANLRLRRQRVTRIDADNDSHQRGLEIFRRTLPGIISALYEHGVPIARIDADIGHEHVKNECARLANQYLRNISISA